MFNFIIPKSSKQPERIIQTIDDPQRNSIETLLFKWQDIQDIRKSDTQCFALINNNKDTKVVSLEALHTYNVNTILWSERNRYIPQLAA